MVYLRCSFSRFVSHLVSVDVAPRCCTTTCFVSSSIFSSCLFIGFSAGLLLYKTLGFVYLNVSFPFCLPLPPCLPARFPLCGFLGVCYLLPPFLPACCTWCWYLDTWGFLAKRLAEGRVKSDSAVPKNGGQNRAQIIAITVFGGMVMQGFKSGNAGDAHFWKGQII